MHNLLILLNRHFKSDGNIKLLSSFSKTSNSDSCTFVESRHKTPEATVYTAPQKPSLLEVEVAELRRQAGQWLRQLRENRGLSQRDLATKVGVDYYTFISQLEMGRGRIPPDRYHVWAAALGLEPRSFVTQVMRYYDPVTYRILFGSPKKRSTKNR